MKGFFFLCIFISNIICAQRVNQADIDSAVSKSFSLKELDSFKNILIANKNLEGWVYYYRKLGYKKYVKGEYDSAIYYEKEALKSFKNVEVKRDFVRNQLTTVYYFLGLAQKNKKQFAKALVNLQKSLDLANRYNYKWKGFITSCIGDCHNSLGNRKTAIQYYKHSLTDSVYRALNRPYIVDNTRIGLIFFKELNNLDSAKYYLKSALKRSFDSDYKSNITAIHSNLGDIYRNENKIDSAVYHYKLQKITYEKFKPTYEHVKLFVLANDSYVKIYKKEYRKALENLNIVYNSIKKIKRLESNDKDLYLTALDNFILYFTRTRNYEQALLKSKEKNKVLKIFHKQSLNERLQELETQYQARQKDVSIFQLKEHKKNQEIILKHQKEISYGLGVFLIAIIGFGYLFWRQRKLKNQYEQVNLEQRLLRSQMNPHFIFNALNVIQNLANKKSKKTNSYILKFSSLLRLILTNSSKEFVSLKDEIKALEDYLSLQSDFNSKFNYTIRIDKYLCEDTLYIPPMLIQPFAENSIEHGINNINKGEICINIMPMNNHKLIKCIVTDNGVGNSKTLKNKKYTNLTHKSISGDIVKERLRIYKKRFKINASFSISDLLDDSKNIIGTKVVIIIPCFED